MKLDELVKYLQVIGYIIATLIIVTLIMTIFNYFDLISSIIMTYYKFLIIIISTFIGGFSLGKKATKKGWLEGLKLGLILIFILFLFAYLGLEKAMSFKNLIYYLIILAVSMLGGMLGINKKEPEN